MKKSILSLLIILVLILTGCTEKEQVVPLIIYDYQDLYMQDFENLIFQEDAYDSYRYVSYDSKNSQIIQNEAVNQVLLDNPQVIIVNPVDRLGVYPIIEKVQEENISIIFINREPLKEDLELYSNVFYVGAKAEQSAIYQAEIIIDLFGGNPNNLNQYDTNEDNIIQCVILKGEPGHQDAEIRTTKVIEQLQDEGYEVEILSIEDAYFSQDIAMEKMRELLPILGPQIEIVISNNDAMAIGAIDALKEEQYFEDTDNDGVINRDTEKWLPVIGIDGLPIAIELIQDGYLYATVLNDSELMAEAINELTNILVTGADLSSLSFDLEDNKYIWIDYKKIY